MYRSPSFTDTMLTPVIRNPSPYLANDVVPFSPRIETVQAEWDYPIKQFLLYKDPAREKEDLLILKAQCPRTGAILNIALVHPTSRRQRFDSPFRRRRSSSASSDASLHSFESSAPFCASRALANDYYRILPADYLPRNAVLQSQLTFPNHSSSPRPTLQEAVLFAEEIRQERERAKLEERLQDIADQKAEYARYLMNRLEHRYRHSKHYLDGDLRKYPRSDYRDFHRSFPTESFLTPVTYDQTASPYQTYGDSYGSSPWAHRRRRSGLFGSTEEAYRQMLRDEDIRAVRRRTSSGPIYAGGQICSPLLGEALNGSEYAYGGSPETYSPYLY